jgi:hypothetical protein
LIDLVDGRAWEASSATLVKREGELNFEFPMSDLLRQGNLARPMIVRFVIERRQSGQLFLPFITTKPVHLELLGVGMSAQEGQGLRQTDLNDPRYMPQLPPVLLRRGMRVWGCFEICVDTTGRVSNVDIWQSADKLVDDDWVATMRSWRYKPYLVDGHPVPFCHPMRLEVQFP